MSMECMLCYQGVIGQRIYAELIKTEYEHWDLAPQPQHVRERMGRKAAGYLISKIHMPTLAQIRTLMPDAVLELAEIQDDAAAKLITSVGFTPEDRIELNGWENQGPTAGQSEPAHFHKHIAPVLPGDVIGGPIAAYSIASTTMTRL